VPMVMMMMMMMMMTMIILKLVICQVSFQQPNKMIALSAKSVV
jgi:hypothetical protein